MAKLTKAQLAELERQQSLSNDWDSLIGGLAKQEQDRLTFTGTTSMVDTTESPFVAPAPVQDDTSLIDRAQGSVQRMLGSGLATAADSTNPFVSTASNIPGFFQTMLSPTAENISRTNEGTGIENAGRLLEAADENKRIADEAQAARNAARGEGIIATPTRWIDETVGDIVDSPSSLASLAGGPFAAVGGADVYAQTYARARAAGMTREQAQEQAGVQAGIEVGMSVIPAGKLLQKLPVGAAVKRQLANEFGTIASRTVTGALRTGAGEAVEEGVTQVLQTEANRALSAIASDPREKDYLAKQLPATNVEYFNEVVRAARAGGVAGTAIGAPASRFEAIAEAARNASDTINAVSSNTRAIPNRPEFGPLEPTPLERRSIEERAILNASRDFLGAPLQQNEGVRQEMASATRPDRAALLREAERTAASVVPDAGMQDAQDFISSPVGAVSRANTIPTSPEAIDVDDELAFNEALADAVVSRTAAVKEATTTVNKQEAGKLRTEASQAAARRRAFMLAEQQRVATLPPAGRVQALAQAAQDYDAGLAETAPQTAQELTRATPVATAPTTRAPTPAAQERAAVRAAEAEEKREAGIASLMAADPTLSRQEAEEAFVPEATPETEADIRAAYANRLSSVAPATQSPAQGMDANSFITAVADRVRDGDSRQANVVAKLIRDGKLVVTNNAEELEPGANPATRGQYDPDTGTLYINAAQMDPANPVGSLLQEVASHEVDHAARVSGNTDVRNAVSGILGETKAARFIEQLKTSNDPIAVEARANADASGETGTNKDLELAAYAMQAASRAYANTSGIPALWRGAVAAARTTAQKYIPGVDVNLNDLGYLGQKMLEATATTEQSLAGDGDRLSTILSRESTGFDQAQSEGLTYLSKDGTEKFVISDAEATVRPNAARRLVRGETLPLSEVLDHPELYDNIPSMKNLPVSVEVRPAGNFATYYPDPDLQGDGRIVVSSDLLNGNTNVDVKAAILHEAQHHVQNQDDTRRENFYNADTDRTPEEQELIDTFRTVAGRNAAATKKLMNSVDKIVASVDNRATKRAIASVQMDRNLTDYGKANEIANLLLDEGIEQYADLSNEVVDTYEQYGIMLEDVNKAQDSYFENITEQEAFFTQDNATNPNPVINPEQAGAFVRPVTRGRGGVRLNSLATTPVPLSAVPYAPSIKQKVLDTLAGQFLWHGKAGKPLGLLQEWQKGFASNIAARASTFFHQLKAGQESVANQFVKEGKSKDIKAARKDVSEMIKSRFTAIGNIPDKRRRDAMIARFVQQYPELSPIQDAVNDINALTDDIIAARMRDPKPLSEDELTQIKFMIDNKSKYVTGVYAAFQGREGRKFVDKLYEDITTANELISKGKEVPAAIKDQVRIYRAALKFVVNNDIAVSDPEHINALSLDSVRDLYNMWRPTLTPDAEGLQNQMSTSEEGYDEQQYKDTMSAVIQQGVSQASSEQFEQLGAAALESLLRQTATGPMARYMRGAKLDTSILEHKEKIPQELKDLYGEVTDLPALLAITMAKQGELAAQSKLLADIKSYHTGDIVIEGNAAEMNKPANREFTERLEGEKWGPLGGMMIRPQQLEALTDYRDTFLDLTTAASLTSQDPNMLATYLASRTGKVMSRAGKGAKIATVVTSPINLVMNAMGSGASMTMAGGVRPDYLWRGLKLAAELTLEGAFPTGVAGRFVPKNTADRDLYFRMNVGESAQAQNMRRAPTDLLRKLVQTMETEGKREITLGSWNKLKNAFGTGWATMMEFFALSDAWIKFPIMLQRANQLEKFAKMEGTKYNIEDIYKEASDYAQDIGMSYNRTAPILRAAEQTSILGTFMPYLQSTFRSIGYGVKHSFNDIQRAINAKTPEGRMKAAEIAARSAAGVLAVLASPQVYQAVANALNDDDEEKAIEAEKGLMEDRFKYGNLVALGQNADGKNLYFQGSRIDARGPATDLLRILTSDADAATKWEASKESLKGLWIMPGMFESLSKFGVDVLTDEKVKNRTTKIERQMPWLTEKIKSAGTAVGVDYSTMESAIEVMDRFNPAGFNFFDPKAEKATQGDRAELGAATLVALAGYRLAAADPEAAALYAGLDYKDIKKDGRAQIAANLGNVGPEAAIAEFREQAAAERRAISKAGEVYQAMIKTGMSRQEAEKVFKDLKIFDATDLANIRNKTYEANDEEWSKEYSTLLSSQSLKQRLKDNPEAEQRVDEIKELINKLGYKKLKDNR